MKVLVAGNDAGTNKSIALCLKIRYPGAAVFSIDRTEDVLSAVEKGPPDLFVIDSSFEGANIPALIAAVRKSSDVPMIVLTAAESDIDRAGYLEAGADDLISREFNPIELLARCRALFRRCGYRDGAREQVLSLAGMTIDLASRAVLLEGQPVRLTPIEYGLLVELAKNQSRVVENRHLLNRVWGPGYVKDPNLVKTCVYRIRAKLKPGNGTAPQILSERGVGYRLVANR